MIIDNLTIAGILSVVIAVGFVLLNVRFARRDSDCPLGAIECKGGPPE